ncbi:MAG: disulfide bond formation protein B, partial [Shimia sp.]
MDRISRQFGLAAAMGSAALLGGAFFFQMLGYAPCAMCLWQRYPHVIAIGAGLLLFALGR